MEDEEKWSEGEREELEILTPEFKGKVFECPCGELAHVDDLLPLVIMEETTSVCPHCCRKDGMGKAEGGTAVHDLASSKYETKRVYNFMKDYKAKKVAETEKVGE